MPLLQVLFIDAVTLHTLCDLHDYNSTSQLQSGVILNSGWAMGLRAD